MSQEEVFIVVPVFNEDLLILRATLKSLLQQYPHVVVVDDGSGGKIGSGIQDLPVHFLRHTINLGQGAALQTGTEYAVAKGAKCIVHFDADGQHDPADIDRLVRLVEKEGVDVVLGSRFLQKSHTRQIPLFRRFVLQLARVINFLFTGVYLSDAHQGLRVLNRKAASLIRLTENRQAHATEIIARTKEHKLTYREVPVSVTYTAYSAAKGQHSLNSLNIMVDLILNKIFK